MTVLHPGLAAAAIASVAVPILIHLLLRRRKRVIEWAAMDLLERALRRDRRRQRLERWILLAARCLLLAVAGVALAQPFVAASDGVGAPARTLWLVIDDGVASAERLADGGTVLERSTTEARRALADLRSGDRVGVVTASEPVRRVIDPPTADTARVESYLSTLESAFTGTDLAGALREAAQAASVESDARVEVLLLGAFRRGSLDPTSPAPVLEGLLPRGARLFATGVLATGTDNAWIAEVEPLRAPDEARNEGDRPIRVRVERTGGSLGASARRISVDGAGGGAADLPISAGERRASMDLRVRSTGADADAAVPIEVSIDGDAQPRDDHRFTVLPSAEAPRVLIVDRRTFTSASDLDRLSAGTWIARAIEPGRGERVEIDEIDPGSLDAATLERSEVAIIARPDLLAPAAWAQVRAFVDEGGAAVVIPAPVEAGQRWFERFREAIEPTWRIDPEVEVAETPWRLAPQQPSTALLRMLGSELSLLAAPVTVFRRLRAEIPAADAETALVFEDGVPLLVGGRAASQRGWVALLTVAPELEWTDLPVRPLMVPLVQELVRQGRRIARTRESAVVGATVEAPRGAATISRRAAAGGAGADAGGSGAGDGSGSTSTFVVAANGRTRDVVTRPGIYDALDANGRPLGSVAVNVDPRRASIEPNAPGAVRTWLQSSGPWTTWGDEAEGRPGGVESPADSSWSFALLIAAAALAVVEMVVARLLSRTALVEGGP